MSEQPFLEIARIENNRMTIRNGVLEDIFDPLSDNYVAIHLATGSNSKSKRSVLTGQLADACRGHQPNFMGEGDLRNLFENERRNSVGVKQLVIYKNPLITLSRDGKKSEIFNFFLDIWNVDSGSDEFIVLSGIGALLATSIVVVSEDEISVRDFQFLKNILSVSLKAYNRPLQYQQVSYLGKYDITPGSSIKTGLHATLIHDLQSKLSNNDNEIVSNLSKENQLFAIPKTTDITAPRSSQLMNKFYRMILDSNPVKAIDGQHVFGDEISSLLKKTLPSLDELMRFSGMNFEDFLDEFKKPIFAKQKKEESSTEESGLESENEDLNPKPHSNVEEEQTTSMPSINLPWRTISLQTEIKQEGLLTFDKFLMKTLPSTPKSEETTVDEESPKTKPEIDPIQRIFAKANRYTDDMRNEGLKKESRNLEKDEPSNNDYQQERTQSFDSDISDRNEELLMKYQIQLTNAIKDQFLKSTVSSKTSLTKLFKNALSFSSNQTQKLKIESKEQVDDNVMHYFNMLFEAVRKYQQFMISKLDAILYFQTDAEFNIFSQQIKTVVVEETELVDDLKTTLSVKLHAVEKGFLSFNQESRKYEEFALEIVEKLIEKEFRKSLGDNQNQLIADQYLNFAVGSLKSIYAERLPIGFQEMVDRLTLQLLKIQTDNYQCDKKRVITKSTEELEPIEKERTPAANFLSNINKDLNSMTSKCSGICKPIVTKIPVPTSGPIPAPRNKSNVEKIRAQTAIPVPKPRAGSTKNSNTATPVAVIFGYHKIEIFIQEKDAHRRIYVEKNQMLIKSSEIIIGDFHGLQKDGDALCFKNIVDHLLGAAFSQLQSAEKIIELFAVIFSKLYTITKLNVGSENFDMSIIVPSFDCGHFIELVSTAIAVTELKIQLFDTSACIVASGNHENRTINVICGDEERKYCCMTTYSVYNSKIVHVASHQAWNGFFSKVYQGSSCYSGVIYKIRDIENSLVLVHTNKERSQEVVELVKKKNKTFFVAAAGEETIVVGALNLTKGFSKSTIYDSCSLINLATKMKKTDCKHEIIFGFMAQLKDQQIVDMRKKVRSIVQTDIITLEAAKDRAIQSMQVRVPFNGNNNLYQKKLEEIEACVSSNEVLKLEF